MKRFLLFVCLFVLPFSLSWSQEPAAPKPVAPFSPAVMSNGTLYLSGQLPQIPETGVMIKDDVKKATEQSMKNMGSLLKQNGLDYEDLVMINIYMANMDDYKLINETYASFFKKKKFPARVAVQVARLPFDVPVEISGIAVKGSAKPRK